MRDRFTDKARNVLKLACSAAGRAAVAEADADYVLLGIAAQTEMNVARAVLEQLGVSLDAFADSFDAYLSPSHAARSVPSEALIEAACREARELNHSHVGTEHLLLAVIRSASSASDYLRRAGLDHARLQRTIKRILGIPDD